MSDVTRVDGSLDAERRIDGVRRNALALGCDSPSYTSCSVHEISMIVTDAEADHVRHTTVMILTIVASSTHSRFGTRLAHVECVSTTTCYHYITTRRLALSVQSHLLRCCSSTARYVCSICRTANSALRAPLRSPSVSAARVRSPLSSSTTTSSLTPISTR
jgi:hypothetical protein